MTRMMTLEKEYEIVAMVLVPMKTSYRIMASSEEDAEQKFTNLVEDEGLSFAYQYDNEYFEATEIFEISDIFLVETNQER